MRAENDNESSEDEDEEDVTEAEVLKTRKGEASPMQLMMKKAIKQSGQSSGSCVISPPLTIAVKSTEVYIINCLKPNEMPWFLDIEYVRMLLKLQFGIDYPNLPLQPWLDTVFKITVRATEHGDNKYRRNDQGYTSSILGWLNEIKRQNSEKAIKKIKQRAKWVFKTIRDHFTDKEGGGKLMLQYIKEKSRIAPDGQVMGLFNSLTRGRPAPHTNVEKYILQKNMHAAFSCTPSFEINVPMDKFMTDDDIKKVTEECLGANNWSDVSTANRKACYKTNWRTQSIPEWSSIQKEGY